MMSDLLTISDQLTALRQMFAPAVECNSGIAIAARDVKTLAERLDVLLDLYANLAQELAILRQTEAARIGRAIIDQLATEQIQSLVRDPEGKVVRPDFGGRS